MNKHHSQLIRQVWSLLIFAIVALGLSSVLSPISALLIIGGLCFIGLAYAVVLLFFPDILAKND